MARGKNVMAPLAAYAQTAAVGAKDIIRLIVRLTVLVYINLFPDPQTMVELIDRLSPLMVMTYPLACVIGYLRAPAVWRKQQTMQRKAKKAAVRKAQKKSMVNELLEAAETYTMVSVRRTKRIRKRARFDRVFSARLKSDCASDTIKYGKRRA